MFILIIISTVHLIFHLVPVSRRVGEGKEEKRSFSFITYAESESECVEKDPSYVPPRFKKKKKDEYEEWDKELFRKHEARLGLKSD